MTRVASKILNQKSESHPVNAEAEMPVGTSLTLMFLSTQAGEAGAWDKWRVGAGYERGEEMARLHSGMADSPRV